MFLKFSEKGKLHICSKASRRKHIIICDNMEETWLHSIKNLETKKFHISWIQEEYNISKTDITFIAINWRSKIDLILFLLKSSLLLNIEGIRKCITRIKFISYKHIKYKGKY